MRRKYLDARNVPSLRGCSLVVSGDGDEVVDALTSHAVESYGKQDTPGLRSEIRAALRDEPPPEFQMPQRPEFPL